MVELALIENYYGDRTTKRSGVKLICHIYEGLAVLDAIGASENAKAAYCLHPLFQSDCQLLKVFSNLPSISLEVLVLVMEYRNQANAWLSDKITYLETGIHMEGKPCFGPLSDVRDMLIADKVQNYKDFKKYHESHERKAQLETYFYAWFEVLEVEPEPLIKIIDDKYPPGFFQSFQKETV